ncbi:aromatic amino acid lyase [Streptomyces sp. NPDC000658]|uniref:aromatic amino acid lyase n=1 Tax=Streptomyces sp. NPDC000658 TaxID=3154266 RepID=UPI003320FA10
MDVTASANGPTRVPPHREGARVLLDGTTLTVGELLALADGEAVPEVASAARERARRSWLTAQRLAASGRLYGRGTGVGAQRSVPVEEDDEAAHGLRLLRSHAGGAGALLPDRQVRAMLAVRANQLLAGGSGIQPAFVDALVDALRLGVHPAVNEYGGIGTGDLTALAQTGLTLIGERPWTRPEPTGSARRAGPGADTAPQGDGTAGQEDGTARQGSGSAEPSGSGGAGSAVRAQLVGASGAGALADPVTATAVTGSAATAVTGSAAAAVTTAATATTATGTAVTGTATATAAVTAALGGVPAPARPSSSPADGSRGDQPAAPVQFVVVPAGRSVDPRPEPPPDARPGTVARDVPARVPRAAELPAAAPARAPRVAPTAAGTPAPVVLRAGDALALLSSNALALGQAALAQGELDVLLRATHAVAALSLAAVSGSPEAYAAPVHALRPYPGAARAAGEVRRLLGLADRPSARPGGRIQDPFGFRAFPQVHGCVLDACERLREVVEVEINCPSENPLMDADDAAAYHHGGFFAAPLGLALDAVVLALLQTAQLSAARLAALGDPGLTGLPAFLATGPVSSSGTMILEYSANSALAELRSSAAPASAGHAVLSRGLEEAASFAGQAARQTLRATEAYATVLACELVCAVRALRLHPEPPRVAALAVAAAALPEETRDRPLTDDVAAAVRLLPVLAGL